MLRDAVRQSVASDPSTPPEVLTTLARDENWLVRAAVLNNPTTSTETRALLAEDDLYIIRYLVASNSSTPTELLTKLAEDEDELVRDTANRQILRREFQAEHPELECFPDDWLDELL